MRYRFKLTPISCALLLLLAPGSPRVHGAEGDEALIVECTRPCAPVKAAVAAIPADRRKVITSHDAFGYFKQAYGVDFIAPQGVSTEAEPSARDIARMTRNGEEETAPDEIQARD